MIVEQCQGLGEGLRLCDIRIQTRDGIYIIIKITWAEKV